MHEQKDRYYYKQTGWVEYYTNWYYFYSNGQLAENTTIDGYVLGPGVVWDKNPEYTAEKALTTAQKKYSNEPDIDVSVSPAFQYKNGEKFYMIYLASKSVQANGGTATIGNYRVFADGRIEQM